MEVALDITCSTYVFYEEEHKTRKCSELIKKDCKLKLFLENKDGITSPNSIMQVSELC